MMASSSYTLWNLRQQSQKVDKKDGEGVVASKRIEKYVYTPTRRGAMLTSQRERAAINLQLLSDICDLASPTTAIGLTNFDDGFIGLTGTVSSLIGVYSQWKKTA